MKTIFSDHAKEQRVRRKIQKKNILDTINNPESSKLSFRGRKLSRKQYGGKILEVVTINEGDQIIVVTQYYLTGESNED